MKIAMIASESNPYVKTGGLADVVYALSKEMAETGEEVEGNKGRSQDRFSEWIFARFGSRNH